MIYRTKKKPNYDCIMIPLLFCISSAAWAWALNFIYENWIAAIVVAIALTTIVISLIVIVAYIASKHY